MYMLNYGDQNGISRYFSIKKKKKVKLRITLNYGDRVCDPWIWIVLKWEWDIFLIREIKLESIECKTIKYFIMYFQNMFKIHWNILFPLYKMKWDIYFFFHLNINWYAYYFA